MGLIEIIEKLLKLHMLGIRVMRIFHEHISHM